MQLILGFLETPAPPGSAPAWAALDDEQRQVVLATLARLIAKVAAAQLARIVVEEERDHV